MLSPVTSLQCNTIMMQFKGNDNLTWLRLTSLGLQVVSVIARHVTMGVIFQLIFYSNKKRFG